MPGRVDQRYELPLAVLGLLAEREMDGGEVIAELRALLGLGYRCAWDSVDSTIEALESEDRRRPYRLTASGVAALKVHLDAQRRVAEVGLRRLAGIESAA